MRNEKVMEAAIEATKSGEWAPAEADLYPHNIFWRRNDSATGAVNSGESGGDWSYLRVWASNDAPLRDVVRGVITPTLPADVHVGGNRIFSAGYEWRKTNGHSPDSEDCVLFSGELPQAIVDFMKSSYAVRSNPLPHLRGMGWKCSKDGNEIAMMRQGVEYTPLYL